MSEIPTTWISGPRPACATEEMIKASAAVIEMRCIIHPQEAWRVAKEAVNAALNALPPAPAPRRRDAMEPETYE